MNIPTLMTRIAALQGHPIPISSRPAPAVADDSITIAADSRQQIRSTRDVRTRRNLVYATIPGARARGGDLKLRMDVMSPNTPGPYPVVIYLPGGGFVFAAKAGAARMRRYVAAAGYVVASVEYRTTRNGATYTEGMADVRSAIDFLRQHAASLRVNTDRVAVWGESAGGYLASMVGVTGGVDAVIDKFGASALERLSEGFDSATVDAMAAPGNAIARYVHGPTAVALDDDVAALRAADPSVHVTSDAPPFLLFHGDDDRIISPAQTVLLHSALRAAGVDSTRYVVTGAGHGEIAVKRGEEKYWTTEPMMRLVVDFLDRTIGPGSPSRRP